MKNLQVHYSLQMLSVHSGTVNSNIFADQTDFALLHTKMKLVVTTQIQLVKAYGPQVQNAIRKVSGLDIWLVIAPLHGPIFGVHETIDYILNKCLHWSSYWLVKRCCYCLSGSMCGNTRADCTTIG